MLSSWSQPAMMMMQLLFGTLLIGLVLTLAITDFRKMILPNKINLLFAAVGACQSLALEHPGPLNALIGSMLGAVLFYSIAISFYRLRGIQGLGRGDQKFVAAAGLWVGWQGLPLLLLIATTSALAFIGYLALSRSDFDVSARFPFGPFLGFGTFVTWTVMATS